MAVSSLKESSLEPRKNLATKKNVTTVKKAGTPLLMMVCMKYSKRGEEVAESKPDDAALVTPSPNPKPARGALERPMGWEGWDRPVGGKRAALEV